MFEGQCIRVALQEQGIVELCFDARGQSVNKFDARTIGELETAIGSIRATSDVRGVLVTSAKNAFIVGADIFEFTAMFAQSEQQIEAHIAWVNSVFTAFEDLEVPSVAAIGGLALGGGLEMALVCDARVMSDATQIGLPEVSLGLFPGFGGTVRLPRLAGAAIAIECISSGKPQGARSVLAAAIIERVVPGDAVRHTAVEVLKSLIGSGTWRDRRRLHHGSFGADAQIFLDAKKKLASSAVHQPAALTAVEHMERAAGCGRDEALRLEHRAFAQIGRTQAASSLIQLFINDQAIKKRAREYATVAYNVRRAAVLGAGVMGGGIAYTSAVRAVPVLMKDIAQNALDVGVSEARKLLAKQVEAQRMSPERAQAVLSDISPMLDYREFGSVDVVIEAVVERIQVKKVVLAEVERLVGPQTIIASNTSSLSITEMAQALMRPENFVGMHFFNPVPVMPLVEVIRGSRTSDQAVATAVAYANTLGKTAIVVKECPGFLVNRILIPYFIGFLRAVNDGADYLQVDRVMEAFGWPMGPAYLSDVVGQDTMLHVLEVICAGFPERMALDFAHAVQALVKQNRLGQKNGSGFYLYANDPKGRPRKTVDPRTADLIGRLRSHPSQSFTDVQVLERLMLPMIIEATRCLEEGIASSPAEVDMSLTLGLGFPRHAGGPLKYADWLGMKHLLERCEAYQALGPLYTPSETMRRAATSGQRFY